MNVSVTVTNTGQRAGKETVILYVRDLVASVAPPGSASTLHEIYWSRPRPHSHVHPAPRRSIIHRPTTSRPLSPETLR
jgi:hypothetical protein